MRGRRCEKDVFYFFGRMVGMLNRGWLGGGKKIVGNPNECFLGVSVCDLYMKIHITINCTCGDLL